VKREWDPSLPVIIIKERTHAYQVLPFAEFWKRGNIVLDGYWQSEQYFAEFRERILEAFNFPWTCHSGWVSVHVRRTDYLTLVDKHPPVPKEWIEAMMAQFPGLWFQFFSDDIAWCQAEFGHRSDCVFSQGHSEVGDLIAMSCCQPTGTRVMTAGGPVPIESLQSGDKVISYSTNQGFSSHRCLIGTHPRKGAPSGRKILSISKRKWRGDLVVVTTETGKQTRYTPDHHCLVRIGNALRGKIFLYLMRRGDQFRIGITSTQRGPSVDFRERFNSETPDCIWLLRSFESAEEARLEEAFASAKFGIPQIPFRRNGDSFEALSDRKRLVSFWQRFGVNLLAGLACLEFYHRDVSSPFYSQGKRHLTREMELIVKASNLLDGMEMLDAEIYTLHGAKGICDSAWTPITISHSFYDGDVYSMTVDCNHTYVGDGLVTHNCEHHICSASTFSWWGAYLDRNPKKRIIIPKHWFGPAYRKTTETKDIVPQSWERM
jgi:hypothetical protein